MQGLCTSNQMERKPLLTQVRARPSLKVLWGKCPTREKEITYMHIYIYTYTNMWPSKQVPPFSFPSQKLQTQKKKGQPTFSDFHCQNRSTGATLFVGTTKVRPNFVMIHTHWIQGGNPQGGEGNLSSFFWLVGGFKPLIWNIVVKMGIFPK